MEFTVSKREKMANDYTRRGLLRRIGKLAETNPQLLQQIVSRRTTTTRTSGGGAQQQNARPRGGVIERGIEAKYRAGSGGSGGGGARRVGGHGGGGGGSMNAYPGSPSYYGRDWGVSDEERKAGDTYAGGAELYRGPETDDAGAQAAIRERLNADLDASADEQRALLAKYSGGIASGPQAQPTRQATGASTNNNGNTTTPASAAAAKAQAEIKELEYKKVGLTDPDRVAELDAKIAYLKDQAGNAGYVAASGSAAPAAQVRTPRILDQVGTATPLLTNLSDEEYAAALARKYKTTPESLLAGGKSERDYMTALTAKPVTAAGPTTLLASHAQPMGGATYSTGASPAEAQAKQGEGVARQEAQEMSADEFEAALAAAKAKVKKQAKASSSGSEGSSSKES